MIGWNLIQACFFDVFGIYFLLFLPKQLSLCFCLYCKAPVESFSGSVRPLFCTFLIVLHRLLVFVHVWVCVCVLVSAFSI